MPCWIHLLVQYPQYQHIPFAHDLVVNRMVSTVATPGMCFHKAKIPPQLRVVR